MKRFISSITGIIMIISFFSNSIIFAESEKKYYNVQIPILCGTANELSTEMINGITTSQEEDKGEIFVSIKDFQKLSNTEIIKSDNNSMDLKRNTVNLKLNINNSNADLSLGYDNNVIKSYDIYVPFINYKNKFYISLIHGLNAFGIEMNIIDKENISNMISVNNRVINDNYMKESIDYLNTKIFDFKKYPQYLQISQSQPFDKLFSEYNNNISKYLFSWQSLYGLNNYTVSLGAFPSNFIANYEGISDYLIGFYEEDERYYDVLCTIINNEQSNNNVDFSIAYKTINFLSDTGLTEMIFDVNDIESFSISSVSDCMKASEKMINLIRCSEFQRNVLDKTILTSDKLKKEMTDDKIITDLVNLSLLNKYINNTYFSSLYNNQYALYQSAVKLDSDIDNSIKNVTYDECKNLIYKSLTSISDKILNSVTLGATEIPDLLMKNIKYNNFINKSILEPSEVLGNLKDCYFIQDTVKSMCSLNIFEESENTYYNLCLILQSSLTAYESLSNNELLLSIIGEEGQTVVEEKIKNINSLLADIENCDVSFYSTNNISDEIEKIKDISVMIVPIEDETQSTEFVEIEETKNYEWYLNPTIEADNIIVPDYDNELFEKYAIIEKNGKYGLISNTGELIEDVKYKNFLICPLNIYVIGNGDVSDFELNNKENIGYKIENEKLIKTNHIGHGIGDITYYYYNINDNKVYAVPQIGNNYKEYKDSNVVLAQSVSISIKEDGTYSCNNIYDDFYLVNNNGKINSNTYENGNNYYFNSPNNIIYAKQNNEWYYFNNKGEQIIFDNIESNYMENGHIQTNKINKNNIINYPFSDVENVIAINTGDNGIFYDIKGNRLTNSKEFEEVRPMINGFAWVKKDGKWGVIKFNAFNSIENYENLKQKYNKQTELKEEKKEKWKMEYTEYIKGIVENDSYIYDNGIFVFVNIDGDDIPEIFYDSGSGYGGSGIITYSNEKVVELHMGNSSHMNYIEGENIFKYSGGHMDSYYDKIYTIKNGEFILIYDGNYGASDNANIQFDSDGNPIYNYYWNDVKVSKEEYNNLINEIYDNQSGINVNELKGNNYNDILKIIENYPNSKYESDKQSNNANQNNTGTVKIEDGYLNVRETPSTKGKIIAKLYNGDKITIEETSEDGKWYKISKGDIKGYVSKNYVKTN